VTIDCHYHLGPRVQPLENLLAKMDRVDISKTALMATMNDPIPHTPEILLKSMRFLLTHRSLRAQAKKLAAKFTPDGNLILPKSILPIYPDPDNEPVAAAITAHPDRFLGWVFVNPRGQQNPLAVWEKWQDHPGFIGVKAHPFWHRFRPLELLAVAERLAAAGKPLLIHVGFDEHGDFLSLVDAVPKLKLILAHTGFPAYADTWHQIKNQRRLFVDLSADAYVNAQTTREAVRFLGVQRCLFGTDGPYGTQADDGFFDNGFIKRRLESLFPDPGIRRQLLGDNFQALLQTSPPD